MIEDNTPDSANAYQVTHLDYRVYQASQDKDHISNLPPEIMLYIFSFLNGADSASASLACKSFYSYHPAFKISLSVCESEWMHKRMSHQRLRAWMGEDLFSTSTISSLFERSIELHGLRELEFLFLGLLDMRRELYAVMKPTWSRILRL